MFRKSFIISLLFAVAFTFSSCDKSGSKGGNQVADPELDKLWSMLSGYWKTSMPDMSNLFYFFGYDDDQKPIGYVIWYHENDEAGYATKIEKLSDNYFRVTLETPANEEEDGLYSVHEGYTTILDIDVSRLSENVLTLSSLGEVYEWEFAGKTADELTYDTCD